jgi:hypothetical protein
VREKTAADFAAEQLDDHGEVCGGERQGVRLQVAKSVALSLGRDLGLRVVV